jgi:hypothetical protein
MRFHAAPIYELLLTIYWDILQSVFMKIQGKNRKFVDACFAQF